MPIILWNDTFLLGIKQFDDDHKHLISLINKVYDNFSDGVSSEKMILILDELVEYTNYHFEAEEYYLAERMYPQILQHKKEHEEFCVKLYGMRAAYNSGYHQLETEVLIFLKDWLKNHIMVADAEYARFCDQSL